MFGVGGLELEADVLHKKKKYFNKKYNSRSNLQPKIIIRKLPIKSPEINLTN